ncbi:S8 family serine peptidase [Actinosynnema sp. NPDC050801]|uniref:S8 family peptidase n=1 Tax=unclassified Actinosynnema TaxID=2637065 RepID=UPI0033E5A49C
MKRDLIGLKGLLAAAALAVGVVAASPLTAGAQEGEIALAAAGTAVEGHYLVVLKGDDVAAQAAELTAKHGGKVTATWQHALRGFAVAANEAEARQLAKDPAVESVSQDGTVQAVDTQPNPPSWGLDRVDQRDLPLNSAYSYDTTAANVHAYVIDTGIRTTHTTFGGRATAGFDAVDGSNVDCHGHGTHVAGTVGGAEYGVAKAVQLVAVRVLNCSGGGTFAGVVSGIDWVTANAVKPAVANMSLGAIASAATVPMETAVRNSIASGITYAIASGNSDDDACGFSPALVTEAVTVNASTDSDSRATDFSNYGTCTDLFAPGVGITSAWATNDTATNTISGTSMAAPHAAGAAALHLATHPDDAPAAVQAALVAASTPDKIANAGEGSPNRLLFTGTPGGPTTVDAIRYVKSRDHMTSTNGGPDGAVREGSVGRLLTTQAEGTHALYRCAFNWDSFTSADPNCEGQTRVAVLGYAYDTAVAGTHPLYRCVVLSNRDHMDSPLANCEGQRVEGVLGYLLS